MAINAKRKTSVYFKYRKQGAIRRRIVDSAIKEIISIAQKELGKPVKEWRVLDVGSGSGEHAIAISKFVKKVVGVEPYEPLYQLALKSKRREKSKVIFFKSLIEDFQLKEKFDLVLGLATIEHTPRQTVSFRRIFRLMEEGGIIFLTTPNKWWPIEVHYKLPFLSWLPLPLANFYLRFTGRGGSYEDSAYSKSYFGLKTFFGQFPCQYRFIVPTDPSLPWIGMGSKNIFYRIVKKVGVFLIKRYPIFWSISKGFIMVIKKI